VRTRLSLDDGTALESVSIALTPPRPGERVAVVVDPAGVVELG
jgi:hypothetical protein